VIGNKGGMKRFFLILDKVLEGFAITLLVAMILIVFLAVITRKVFGFVFVWSEEVTLLCLTWFTFMGIAIGFRERLHLGMDLFDKLPKKILNISDRLIDAATQLPNAVQYIVMPITGIMTCVYAGLQFLGRDLRRYHVIEEEIVRDAE
jgi:TRAP-type C4-dicarboxylate transport system permease small subunit